MAYKKQFGRYEVRCEYDGFSKWFKYLDKAQAFFEELTADLEEDLDGTGDTEVVILEDIKSGETIRKQEIGF